MNQAWPQAPTYAASCQVSNQIVPDALVNVESQEERQRPELPSEANDLHTSLLDDFAIQRQVPASRYACLMELTKALRNEIFEAVVAGGLNVAECELHYEGSSYKDRFVVEHVPTKSWIQAKVVGSTQTLYECKQRVGTDPAQVLTDSPVSWAFALQNIARWAKVVIAWEGAPDLWELRHNWEFLSGQQSGDSANTPFTEEELEAISAQLAAIKESVKKIVKLTAEQEAKIDVRFDEAEKASKRIGRKDWVLLFGGSVLSLILGDAITPRIAGHIMTMAVHGLEHLFMSGPRSIRSE